MCGDTAFSQDSHLVTTHQDPPPTYSLTQAWLWWIISKANENSDSLLIGISLEPSDKLQFTKFLRYQGHSMSNPRTPGWLKVPTGFIPAGPGPIRGWCFTSRNMFDHPMPRQFNRGFNGNLCQLFIFYSEYWKQVGQLLKYLLHELDAGNLSNATATLLGYLVKLKNDLKKRPSISIDGDDWWKKIVKPVIPLSVSPTKSEISVQQQVANQGSIVLTPELLVKHPDLQKKYVELINEAAALEQTSSSSSTTTTATPKSAPPKDTSNTANFHTLSDYSAGSGQGGSGASSSSASSGIKRVPVVNLT